MKKPNVLFFFTDDQRFDTINALGNKAVSTPNMDELVENGVSFTHAHIMGGTVGAVCMPSRAMINSGRSLFNLCESGTYIPETDSLLGETLKNNGYQTIGIGKWHNGKRAYQRSFTNGGEIFFGGMNDHWNVPVFHFDPDAKYDHQMRETHNWSLERKVSFRHGDYVNSGVHSSEVFANEAIRQLENLEEDKPFYMYLAFMAPHDPRTMPDEFKKMYNPDDIELPPNYMTEHTFKFGVEKIRDEVLAAQPRVEHEVKEHIAEYYGMISHLDYQLGRVVQKLKDMGEYENTIIVFAGDNGIAVGQHGLFGKQSCYEHSMRVPLIFSGAGMPKNKRTNSYALLLDIFPTLCDVLGIETPNNLDGESLKTAIEGDDKIRDNLYLTYGCLARAYKDDRFKLIEYRNETAKHTQLFDLENDPWEMNNLIDDKQYEEKANQLREKMIENAKELNDTTNYIGKDFWDRF